MMPNPSVLSPDVKDLHKTAKNYLVPRHCLQRAVCVLSDKGLTIEALAMIRAAYDCSLNDARLLLDLIQREYQG